MANTRARNVIKVDTTATFTGQQFIRSIKYIGSATGTAIITDAGNTNRLWEEAGTANLYNPNVEIVANEGITVTVANSAVVYLYLK